MQSLFLPYLILLAISGVWTASTADDTETARAVCVVLCGNCRGFGRLIQDVCVCQVPRSDTSDVSRQCYAEARLRAFDQDMGWKLMPTSLQRSQLFPPSQLFVSEPHTYYQRRRRRDVSGTPQLVYNPAMYSQPHSMAYPLPYYQTPQRQDSMKTAGIQPQPAVPVQIQAKKPTTHTVVIGKNNKDRVEFFIPNLDGVQIKHEYIYRTPDGKEYPFESPDVFQTPERTIITHKHSSDEEIPEGLTDITIYPTDNPHTEDIKRYASVEPGPWYNTAKESTSDETEEESYDPSEEDSALGSKKPTFKKHEEETYENSEEGSYERTEEKSSTDEEKDESSYEKTGEENSTNEEKDEKTQEDGKSEERSFEHEDEEGKGKGDDDSLRSWEISRSFEKLDHSEESEEDSSTTQDVQCKF